MEFFDGAWFSDRGTHNCALIEYFPETFANPDVDVSLTLPPPFKAMNLSVKLMRSDVLLGSGIVILTFEEATSSQMFKLWQFGLPILAEEAKVAKVEPNERRRGILSIVERRESRCGSWFDWFDGE